MMDWRQFRSLAWMARELPAFVRQPVTLEMARAELSRRLATRAERLIASVRALIYDQPLSPYRRLLFWAGCEWGDFADSVRRDGVEPTLQRLHRAGVYVSLEELKGRQPICRPGLTLEVRASDFDNPYLLGRGLDTATSGSSGSRARVPFDWHLMAEHAVNERLLWNALGLEGRTMTLWLPVPPSVAGIHHASLAAKCRWPIVRWFSPTDPCATPWYGRDRLAIAWLRRCCRWYGVQLPAPEHATVEAAPNVARWVAARASSTMVRCYTSLAVRLAACAELPGTVFLTGGEPLTETRRRVIERAGARAFARYTATESGMIAGACAKGVRSDDMHVYEDRLAVFGDAQQRLWITSLSPLTGKVLLNADLGDCGELERRGCGCALGAAGLTLHVSCVRSARRLNAEGMTVLAADLADWAQELVQQAGGCAEDVQVNEMITETGMTRVRVYVSPRVTGLDEGEFLRALRSRLAAHSRGGQLAADVWAQAGTLELVRQEPSPGATGKMLVRRIHAEQSAR
ncbi:MAG: hypothetical protein RMM51_12175 [Verrucomicrobiae bacterium]|nr:hypothetical protein [Verrucomicrobiae bacterium]